MKKSRRNSYKLILIQKVFSVKQSVEWQIVPYWMYQSQTMWYFLEGSVMPDNYYYTERLHEMNFLVTLAEGCDRI